MYTIYKITNCVNGKIYIGYTEKSPQERFAGHLAEARRPRSPLQKALKKYGKDCFTVEAIFQHHDKDYVLNDREQYFIETYENTVGKENMYNVAPGGLGGDRSMSPRHKEYIRTRDITGKKNPFYGKTMSEESKAYLRSLYKGKKREGFVPYNKGVSTPKHIVEKQVKNNPQCIRVLWLGNEYDSISQAAKATGYNPIEVGKKAQRL